MRYLALVCGCMVLLAGCATRPTGPKGTPVVVSKALEPSLEKLRKLDIVEGDAVGFGGEGGDFYELSVVFLRDGTADEFLGMLRDPNPVVRVMGIWCLNKTDRTTYWKAIRSMFGDEARVKYNPAGCSPFRYSVGEIARRIFANPHELEWAHYH